MSKLIKIKNKIKHYLMNLIYKTQHRLKDTPKIIWEYQGDKYTLQKNNSIEAFKYVSYLRKQNGRNAIQWDDNIWRLAVSRSKDMYSRNYFDHMTPEGKCVKYFKSDYGLNRYTIAENIGALYIGNNKHNMSFSKKINVKKQIARWMNSRGHRYNKMYIDHIKGAIGLLLWCLYILGSKHGCETTE